jgi:hypothetical protein
MWREAHESGESPSNEQTSAEPLMPRIWKTAQRIRLMTT